jgi:hypothetical protein
MATYLIDFENVHQNGLEGLNRLTENDSVIIFIGSKETSVPIETLYRVVNSPAQIKIKKMKKTADNYLDFQLATCLGGLVMSDPVNTEFFIISNDRDFESVIDYWKANKPSAAIIQRNTISASVEPSTTTQTAAAQDADAFSAGIKKKIGKVLARFNLAGGNYSKVYNIFKKYKTKDTFLKGIKTSFIGDKYKNLGNELLPFFEEYRA